MPEGRFRDLLGSAGFQSYLWTQFLGAFNDNCYKMSVSLLAAATATEGSGALPLVGVVFMIPFFLFSGYAGQLADIHSKRTVQIAMKLFELAVMLAAILAFSAHRIEASLAVLFLMAMHSTFFSPAKYGIVPQIVGPRDITRANSLLELTTFGAIILGTGLGAAFFEWYKTTPGTIGMILSGVAVVGLITSFGIPRVPAQSPGTRFNWNPWTEIAIGLKHLYVNKPLWLTVLAISYFWFLGALFQMLLIVFGTHTLGVTEARTGILITFLALGIGIGSMLAGRLSGDKVELGLVPLGSIGMGLTTIALAVSGHSYNLTAAVMVVLGVFCGIFIVPLNAYLQARAESGETGRMLAVNNFLNTIGILIASGVFALCNDVLKWTPPTTIFVFGLASLGVTVYILTVIPEFLIRFSFWMLTHTFYRIRIEGVSHVPFRGPALLVCNHVSFVDALLVGACIQRFVRFMMFRPIYEMKFFGTLFRKMNAIPVSASRRDVVDSLARARKELEAGHIVCIFAEGAITRTGNLLPFKRGFERIIDDLDVPVIPVHLDRLWGSMFSFDRGQFLWKRPQRFPYPVTVSFGPPIPSSTANAFAVRQAVAECGARATELRAHESGVLPQRFFRNVRRHWGDFCMTDSSGKELTYGKTAIAATLLEAEVRRHAAGDRMVGILLPSSIGGALANIAVSLTGKVPVNLNFTIGADAIESAIDQCGIRVILTSKLFLTKAKLPARDGMVYLEDLLKRPSKGAQAAAAAKAVWRAIVPPTPAKPHALATVIFSSSSTGTPKGVMLSHANAIANIEAMGQMFWITERDRMMGVLPLFHSFGFTVGLWFPLVAGCGAVYHANPVDASVIGDLSKKYGSTILISTPTFYSTYIRKIDRDQFATLRFALVGAEKLRDPIADAFREKFGIDLLEGYGATEMSPVISVNAPNYDDQTGAKRGTVGQPMPGVAAKVVSIDFAETLGANQDGLLLVRGASRMIGYLNQPKKTADVLRDGWYVTGDIVRMDDDGFITIVDRLSRFSKIGGEMVPHIKIEAAVAASVGDAECAVTALPDEQKGERLIVLHTRADLPAAEIWSALNSSDLPKLWVPKRENIFAVEAIPKLGTGKVDLRGIKQLAAKLAG